MRTTIRKRAVPILRVAGFLACVVVIAVAIGFRSARAQLDERMIAVGESMMRYAGSDAPYRMPRGLVLNGERLWFSMDSTQEDLDDVLDFYEQGCKRPDGRPFVSAANVGARRPANSHSESTVDSILREDDSDRGYVACVDMSSTGASSLSLADRVRALGATGDLGSVGEMRYAFARRVKDRTQIMTFWTQGSFNLRRVFPVQGDAPGRDVSDVPRPPGARRQLSARSVGDNANSFTLYTGASLDAARLQSYYERSLKARGYALLQRSGAPIATEQGRATRALTAEKDGRTITLVFFDGIRRAQGASRTTTTAVLASR